MPALPAVRYGCVHVVIHAAALYSAAQRAENNRRARRASCRSRTASREPAAHYLHLHLPGEQSVSRGVKRGAGNYSAPVVECSSLLLPVLARLLVCDS